MSREWLAAWLLDRLRRRHGNPELEVLLDGLANMSSANHGRSEAHVRDRGAHGCREQWMRGVEDLDRVGIGPTSGIHNEANEDAPLNAFLHQVRRIRRRRAIGR